MGKKAPYQGRIIRKRSHTLSSLGLYRMEETKRKRPVFIPFAILLLGLICLYLFLDSRGSSRSTLSSPLVSPEPYSEIPFKPSPQLLAQGLHRLNGASCVELSSGKGPTHTLYTGLDQKYQKRVERRLRQSMALGGVVAALEPSSGRILALAAYNKDPEQPQAFLWKAYPAASLFKIVTAAAALELGVLEPGSVLAYTGRNHTLYRRDLQKKVYPWSNRVSLKEAFALSVNPVFGKIGIHWLGRAPLREFGAAFFFGQWMPCEVPFEASRFNVPEDNIGIAEIASGFNRQTLVTPLHAAWIGSVLVAGGAASPPWLVERIQEEQGREIYKHQEEVAIRVLSPPIAKSMQALMEATVRYGTCHKSFAGRRRDRHLRSVVFGGKTGNINNRKDTIKYDWFLGYGRDTEQGHQLALSVMMIHGRYLGHRANVVAFDLLRYYFRTINPS
jgi:cell division protein FtsI/penicillin-binding protein 2